VRVIAESDAMQEFLTDSEDQENLAPVDLKVNKLCTFFSLSLLMK